MPSSYALGAYYEKWVKDQVASGRYNNASEVIRDALRLLQDRQMKRPWTIEEIREAVRASDEGGPGIDPGEAFAITEADLDEYDRLEAKHPPKAAE